jgi:ABC-type cobalamin/Fe3+-siderophores transport system ATPase subunit
MVMLGIENISFAYGREKILKNLSVEIKDGEFFGIIGPNGSGKTTLLKIATKILNPSSGRILLDGKDVKEIPSPTRLKSLSPWEDSRTRAGMEISPPQT